MRCSDCRGKQESSRLRHELRGRAAATANPPTLSHGPSASPQRGPLPEEQGTAQAAAASPPLTCPEKAELRPGAPTLRGRSRCPRRPPGAQGGPGGRTPRPPLPPLRPGETRRAPGRQRRPPIGSENSAARQQMRRKGRGGPYHW